MKTIWSSVKCIETFDLSLRLYTIGVISQMYINIRTFNYSFTLLESQWDFRSLLSRNGHSWQLYYFEWLTFSSSNLLSQLTISKLNCLGTLRRLYSCCYCCRSVGSSKIPHSTVSENCSNSVWLSSIQSFSRYTQGPRLNYACRIVPNLGQNKILFHLWFKDERYLNY